MNISQNATARRNGQQIVQGTLGSELDNKCKFSAALSST